MAISRWDPMQNVPTLRDAMSRLLDESIIRPTSMLARALVPPMDVYLEGDDYVIEMALPGVPPDSVNVSVLGNQVTISGEFPAAPEGRQYLLQEQPRGRFERTVMLPTEVDPNKARGEHDNGMLRLILPKAESAKPHRIPIGGTAGQRMEAQPISTQQQTASPAGASSQPTGTQTGTTQQAGSQAPAGTRA
jgi:HSP20 family protein